MSKIVIIEDNALIAKLYENKLTAEGHTVKVAADGASGFQLIKDFRPDAVLLDLMLPEMSGAEIIRQLRRDWEYTNVPILAYSGGDEEVLDAAREAGTTAVVSKGENSLKEILTHMNEMLELTQNWQIYGNSNFYSDNVEPAPANGNGEVKESETVPANGKRVLIVEDDLLMIALVRDIVEKAGYTAVVAGDGKEAFKILSNDADFAAGIFDVNVPHIQGTDLVRHMRTERRLMKIPVIVMTAEESIKIQSNSMSAGASIFIPKPFERQKFETMFLSVAN